MTENSNNNHQQNPPQNKNHNQKSNITTNNPENENDEEDQPLYGVGIKGRSKSVKIVTLKKKKFDPIDQNSNKKDKYSYLKTPQVNAPRLRPQKNKKAPPLLSLGSISIKAKKNDLGVIQEENINLSAGEEENENESSESNSFSSKSDSDNDVYEEIEEMEEYEEIEIDCSDNEKEESIEKIISSDESENDNLGVGKKDSTYSNLRFMRRKMTDDRKSFHIKKNKNICDVVDQNNNENFKKFKEDVFKDEKVEKVINKITSVPQKKCSILSMLRKKSDAKI